MFNKDLHKGWPFCPPTGQYGAGQLDRTGQLVSQGTEEFGTCVPNQISFKMLPIEWQCKKLASTCGVGNKSSNYMGQEEQGHVHYHPSSHFRSNLISFGRKESVYNIDNFVSGARPQTRDCVESKSFFLCRTKKKSYICIFFFLLFLFFGEAPFFPKMPLAVGQFVAQSGATCRVRTLPHKHFSTECYE